MSEITKLGYKGRKPLLQNMDYYQVYAYICHRTILVSGCSMMEKILLLGMLEENGSIYYFNINNDCTNQVEFSIQMNYSIYSNYMAGERICDIDEIRLN